MKNIPKVSFVDLIKKSQMMYNLAMAGVKVMPPSQNMLSEELEKHSGKIWDENKEAIQTLMNKEEWIKYTVYGK